MERSLTRLPGRSTCYPWHAHHTRPGALPPRDTSSSLDLETASTGIAVLALIVILGFCGYGWVHNVGKPMSDDCGQNIGCVAVRAFGVPMVPLGAAAGYF